MGKMEQNPLPELSEEELRELSIGLLREWWIAATQALVDTAGSETALKYLKPYSVHAGKAGGIVFQRMTDIPSNCIPAIVHGTGAAMAVEFNGVLGRGYMASDGSLIRELIGCSTRGLCKEACIAFCDYACGNALMEYAPSYEMKLARSLAFGDDSCHWLIFRKGEEPLVAPREEFLTPLDFKQPYVPTEDLKKSLSHAYAGEFWVITTRAFIDYAGSEKALERLCFYLRHSGMSLGIRLSDRLNAHDKKMGSIVELVEIIQGLHQRKGTIMKEEGGAEGEVLECPFSSSPSEMCLQYEAFFNGICEALDPTIEFRYDSMMTKGSDNCHWVIKKKGTLAKAKPTEEKPSGDPAIILGIRYAKGEITKQELAEMMANLRHHGLVK